MGWLEDTATRLNKGCWGLLIVYAALAAISYLVWRLWP